MNGILRISEAAAIGVHAVAALAARHEGRLSSHEMADAMKASEAHLAKVMRKLVTAGLVSSERGPSGGFSLARPPAKISLLEVYEAIEGKFPSGHCLFASPVCKGKGCPLGGFIGKINKDALDYFKSTNIESLAKGAEDVK